MRLPVVGVVSSEGGDGPRWGVSATATYAHGTGLRDAGCRIFSIWVPGLENAQRGYSISIYSYEALRSVTIMKVTMLKVNPMVPHTRQPTRPSEPPSVDVTGRSANRRHAWPRNRNRKPPTAQPSEGRPSALEASPRAARRAGNTSPPFHRPPRPPPNGLNIRWNPLPPPTPGLFPRYGPRRSRRPSFRGANFSSSLIAR